MSNSVDLQFKLVKAWKCPYCDEVNMNKDRTIHHTSMCDHNHKIKGCRTCDHFEYGVSPCKAGKINPVMKTHCSSHRQNKS